MNIKKIIEKVIKKELASSMNKKLLNFLLGVIVIGLSVLIWVNSNKFISESHFYQFLNFTAFSFLGLGIRSCFYHLLFVSEPEVVNIMDILRGHIYYLMMLIIITCLIYLGFYQAFKDLKDVHFWLFYFALFFCMGLSVETTIQKFGR